MRGSLPAVVFTTQPFSLHARGKESPAIAARWSSYWHARCELVASRLASSLLPRDSLMNVYQDTHRRAVLAALARHIPMSTIAAASLDDPLATDEERSARLTVVMRRKIRKQEITDARRT